MPRKNKAKQLEYQRTWYKRNAKAEYERIHARRVELALWLAELKSTMRCSICGENHIACLEFHHKDPNTKDFNVSEIAERGFSKKRALEEISKCDIVCSNCHKKIHYAWNLPK